VRFAGLKLLSRHLAPNYAGERQNGLIDPAFAFVASDQRLDGFGTLGSEFSVLHHELSLRTKPRLSPSQQPFSVLGTAF